MDTREMTYAYHRIKLPDGTTRDEHRLVVEKALGRRLTWDECVHHINGNPRDNRLENLEIISHSAHTRLHLTGQPGHTRGEKVCTAVLTALDVISILGWLEDGLSERRVAALYGVSRRAIRDIKHGVTWKHVTQWNDPEWGKKGGNGRGNKKRTIPTGL
jgi:uncharacterized protein (DUF433 family)